MLDDFFGTAETADARARSLKALPMAQQLALEKLSVSEHSPGPIGDSEGLFRALDQPIHFQNGELTPTAFGDAEARGLSINRTSHISIDGALSLAIERVKRVNQRKAENLSQSNSQHAEQKRRTFAYTVFKTLDLRMVLREGPDVARRAFGVYDTAKQEDISHGDVFFLLTERQAWRSMRSKLYELAKPGLVVLD